MRSLEQIHLEAVRSGGEAATENLHYAAALAEHTLARVTVGVRNGATVYVVSRAQGSALSPPAPPPPCPELSPPTDLPASCVGLPPSGDHVVRDRRRVASFGLGLGVRVGDIHVSGQPPEDIMQGADGACYAAPAEPRRLSAETLRDSKADKLELYLSRTDRRSGGERGSRTQRRSGGERRQPIARSEGFVLVGVYKVLLPDGGQIRYKRLDLRSVPVENLVEKEERKQYSDALNDLMCYEHNLSQAEVFVMFGADLFEDRWVIV